MFVTKFVVTVVTVVTGVKKEEKIHQNTFCVLKIVTKFKTQIMTKPKNSNCEKKNSKIQSVTKLDNSNCVKTQKLKL